MTTIGEGRYRFEWDSHWAKLPEGIELGYTHGVVVDREGLVHVFNQSRHAVLTFDPDGRFLRTWNEFPSDRFLGAHGMTLVEEEGEEFLWLTDQRSAEVVKTTLSGETVLTIGRPEHPAYREADARYAPTWVAQSPIDGTVYVADGYGSSWISRYDRDGRYLDSFDGSGGAGRFQCPHGLWIGRRPQATGRDEPVLYVTDRGNGRVQVFDLDLGFVKAFDQPHPCSFAERDGELLVPDLYAFIRVYDEHDRIAADRLGDHRERVVAKHGWPNVPPELRLDGKFNSPHGGAFDADGNIYIVEWIADGRITRLTRRPSP